MSAFASFAGPATQNIANRPSIYTRGVNAVFGGLGTLGTVLDTPGSIARGILNSIINDGEFERAFTGIFNPEERVTGTELIGGDKDEFTVGGLAAEIVTDPLNFFTFGAKTVVGELAQRAGKLEASQIAQRTLVDQGEESIRRKLTQTQQKQGEIAERLSELGRDPGETIAKSIRDQFRQGQRSLIQFDIPFTSIQKEVANSVRVGTAIGSASDVTRAVVTQNPVAKELRQKFVIKRKDPIEEALRQEYKALRKGVVQRARREGRRLVKQRLLLEATDPNVDFKAIELLEKHGDLLDDVSGDLVGGASNSRMRELLNARLNIEEMYGQADNFEEVWAFAQQLRTLNKEILGLEQQAGVAVKELDNLGYISRVITPEGAALLNESKKGINLLKNALKVDAGSTSAFQKTRTFRDLGLKELNEQLAELYGKDPSSFQFFDTNLAAVQVSRFVDSAKQLSRTRLAQASVDLFGVERSDVLIKEGKQVGIEKVLSPLGPLVAAMKVKLDISPDKYVSNLIKRHNLEEIRPGVVRIADHELDVTNEDAVRLAFSHRLKKNFTKISEAHKKLDEGLDTLVINNAITETQQRFLRTMFAHVDPEIIEGLDIKGMTEARVLGKAVPGDPGTIYLRANRIQELNEIRSRGPLRDQNQTFGKPVNTFLHEFGHIWHFILTNRATKSSTTGNVFDIEEEVFGSVHNLVTTAELTSEGDDVMRRLLGGEWDEIRKIYSPDNYASEVFARLFARWMAGTKTTDANINKLLKKAADEYTWIRDGVWSDMAVREFIEDQALTEPIDALEELFAGTVDGNAARVLNNIPAKERKAYLTQMLDDQIVRRDYIDLPIDANEKAVRDILKEKGVDRTAIPSEVADFVEDVIGKSRYHLDQDKWWAKTIRTMDEIHSMMRTAFTQYFPAFHNRNFISNVFMNSMAGGVGLKHYVRAINKLRSMDEAEAIYLGSLSVLDSGKMREVFEMMEGSRGGISRKMKDLIRSLPGGDTAAQAGKAVNKGTRAYGEFIEDFTRYAHFLAKKEAGFTDQEAAESVMKYLFDYQDLTDFERAVPRRAMLFYTFFRKNLPLMLEQTFSNPRFMMLYARATGQTNPNIVQPEWLPDSFFLGDDEKGNTIRLNFGLPPEDLARFDPEGKGLQRVAELVLSNMVPAIREPFQFVSGKDFFTGRPREGNPLEIVAGQLPTARATGTLGRILEAAEGDGDTTLASEVLRALSGISSRRIDEDIQRKINQLDQIRDRLNELVVSGNARKIEIVGQRRGQEPNEEVRALNSMQSRILRTLAEQREQ